MAIGIEYMKLTRCTLWEKLMYGIGDVSTIWKTFKHPLGKRKPNKTIKFKHRVVDNYK